MTNHENRLKRILEDRQMKQTELAAISGISPVSINRYVQELREPKIQDALKIANALNMRVDDIWELDFYVMVDGIYSNALRK